MRNGRYKNGNAWVKRVVSIVGAIIALVSLVLGIQWRVADTYETKEMHNLDMNHVEEKVDEANDKLDWLIERELEE